MVTEFSKSICYLERIIGRNCYNVATRRHYRYPVRYRVNGKLYECSSLAKVPEESIDSMHYQFGSNTLYIGKALKEIIDYLETQDYDAGLMLLYDSNGDEIEYADVISALEIKIAHNCYSQEFHRKFRYPVHYRKNSIRYIAKGHAEIINSSIYSMYYEFGANLLHIGKALDEMLGFISDNYPSISALDYIDPFEEV